MEISRKFSSPFTGIDSVTPVNEILRGKYLKSFAYHTIKERLPVILTNVLDQLVRHKMELTGNEDNAEEELKACIRSISRLTNEVQTNKPFIELVSKGVDAKLWNDYLSQQTKGSEIPTWFNAPWLYSECYMYRRLREIFETSHTLNKYDHFLYVKNEELEKRIPDLKLVAKYVLNALKVNQVKEKEYYLTVLKIALWGNRCDLSLSKGKNLEMTEINHDFVKSLDDFLLIDDSRKLYKIFSESQTNSPVIAYVVDNAGFELFCDFCFCDFLMTYKFATKVIFHVKKIPWFVSDATNNDVKNLLSKMENIGLVELVTRWKNYFDTSVWKIEEENYWTTPFHYGEMITRDPSLYKNLAQMGLIIFKGDLNYRKLLRDLNWKPTEKFEVVLGKFHPTNIFAMRTVKSDLICGLTPEKIAQLPSDQNWMTTGEYGVIQLYSKY